MLYNTPIHSCPICPLVILVDGRASLLTVPMATWAFRDSVRPTPWLCHPVKLGIFLAMGLGENGNSAFEQFQPLYLQANLFNFHSLTCSNSKATKFLPSRAWELTLINWNETFHRSPSLGPFAWFYSTLKSQYTCLPWNMASSGQPGYLVLTSTMQYPIMFPALPYTCSSPWMSSEHKGGAIFSKLPIPGVSHLIHGR